MSESKYNRKAVYTGRRISGPSSKIYHRFELLPERSEMFFQGVRRVYIGYTYECSADRIAQKPVKTDDERIDNPEWDAADALIDQRRAEKRAEAKIKASTRPALKAAIAALRPLMRNLGYFQRKALVEYLAEESRKKS